MKSFSNRKLNSIFSIMFVFFTLFFLSAKSLIAEKITNYDVTVQINKNGTLTVNEVIDYEFDDAAKHGIYRDIPLRSKKNGVDIYKSYINRGVHFNSYNNFFLSDMISRGYNNAYNKIVEERFSTLRENSRNSSGSGFGGGGFSSGGGFSGGGSGGGGGGSW